MQNLQMDSKKLEANKSSMCVLKLMLANFVILMVAYSTLLSVPHFSTDTYSNYVTNTGNIGINIVHGRFVSALLYQIFAWLSFDYHEFAAAGSFIFVVICSWGVTILTWRFYEAQRNRKIEKLVSLDIVMLTLALNTSIMEDLLFPDVSFSYSLCFLLCFASAVFWCNTNHLLKSSLKSICVP